MSSDDNQFHLSFDESGAEIPERDNAATRKPSVRKAKHKTVKAEANLAFLPAAIAYDDDGHANHRFLSVGEVALRYSVSVPTIWRWQKNGTLPRCYQIGPGTSRWLVAELDAHDRQLPQGSKR